MPRREVLLENGIERFLEALPRGDAVGGRVLVAVGNPNVGYTGTAEGLAKGRADFAGTNAVLNPKFPDIFVAMRKRKTVRRFWV